MRKLMLIPLITALLLVYLSHSTFSYFSDTETITVELTAANPPSSATVLYDNATLTFLCHHPCCHGGSGGGGLTKDLDDLEDFVKRAPNNPGSLEHAPSCFRKICRRAVLDGVYVEVQGSGVILKKIVVNWWDGGRLNYLKIDNQTFEVNSTSPAGVNLGVALEGGLHPLELGFSGIISPVFEIRFVFEDRTETIYFVPCIKFEWV